VFGTCSGDVPRARLFCALSFVHTISASTYFWCHTPRNASYLHTAVLAVGLAHVFAIRCLIAPCAIPAKRVRARLAGGCDGAQIGHTLAGAGHSSPQACCARADDLGNVITGVVAASTCRQQQQQRQQQRDIAIAARAAEPAVPHSAIALAAAAEYFVSRVTFTLTAASLQLPVVLSQSSLCCMHRAAIVLERCWIHVGPVPILDGISHAK
jgi:hypothetical protein